jgi:L-lactate dehydrogenase
MRFTLIGFGEVGSLVGALINTSFNNIRINVVNTQIQKSGRILDLEHAAAVHNNVITHNDPSEFEHADFVVYSAGFSNAHGQTRNTVALKNKELVFSIFNRINFQKRPKIIVITNPVEPISFWVNHITGDSASVIGTGTSLDTFRLKFILAKKFKCSTNEVDCFVVGEHGQHMVPIYSQTTIKGEPIHQLCSERELELITDELVHSAFQIRETEKATKYGIAESTMYLLNALLSDEPIVIPASSNAFGVWKDHLTFKSPIYMSLPYSINKTGCEPNYVAITEQEMKKLQQAIDAISEQIT